MNLSLGDIVTFGHLPGRYFMVDYVENGSDIAAARFKELKPKKALEILAKQKKLLAKANRK